MLRARSWMRWARRIIRVENRAPADNGEMVAPNGSIGFRWGEKGKWNLEQRRYDRR
jgi:nitrate reductase alpha subunit